ncbi:hypothetical protein ACA910_012047 [Epithemia clementina (nom. ined.)]
MTLARYVGRGGIIGLGVGLYGVTVYYSYHQFKCSKTLRARASEAEEGQSTTSTTNSNATTTTTPATTTTSTTGCCSCAGSSRISDAFRSQQFSRIADCYDSAIGLDEFFLGITLLRRTLLRYHAQGTVLEVGAGTGRNLPYYMTDRVKRVILVDASESMLQQAQAKITQQYQPQSQYYPPFVVRQGDSASLSFCPSQAFDTVVDTFGLCSYDDPVAVLREMVRVCKPNGGKILLLEHGRSKSWSWVTNHLDKYQEDHARKWGCIWNRDLDALLAAVDDVLEIKVLSLYHFGTTYYVVCQPRASTATTTSTTATTSEENTTAPMEAR